VDNETALRIIARIKEVDAQRVVFTGGDPLHRADAAELIRYAKEIELETALSTTGDRLTPGILTKISPFLDLISLPLDGSTEEVNARTKHPGHFSTIMQVLDWLHDYPAIDVKVCTPVTRHNLDDVPAIAHLVEDYAITTQARVFYNIFQAFPRAMFSVKWEKLLVTNQEFATLRRQIGNGANVRISFLDHETLDRLYVLVFPDGSMVIPRGADYLNFGQFLELENLDGALEASQFDSPKHLRHSREWAKRMIERDDTE
jgi:MoaA/NifB/PqqE/SkfB family radical SAM enzyme